MRIFGVDFTSRPCKRKPISCAVACLERERLQVQAIEYFVDFTQFEAFLRRPGPWIAGLDFPFGQPRRLVENLSWPPSWAGYVRRVATIAEMRGWETLLADYRARRPPGDKQHLRATDRLAGARSPMMLFGVPVGKMFFRGAPRLLRAGVGVLPCHPTGDSRIALEAYPALVVQRLLGRLPYKNDARSKQTETLHARRRELLRQCRSARLRDAYGLELHLAKGLAGRLIDDPSADGLDSVLCAIQAAWGCSQRAANYGIPANADPLEGWILDPSLRLPT